MKPTRQQTRLRKELREAVPLIKEVMAMRGRAWTITRSCLSYNFIVQIRMNPRDTIYLPDWRTGIAASLPTALRRALREVRKQKVTN